jgi:thiol-disulfide isomerase/thioredoxin
MCKRVIPQACKSLLLNCACWFFFAGVASAADGKPTSTLHLSNDGFIAGELRGSDNPQMLRWHSPLFASPLEFPLSALKAVQYEVAGQPPAPLGEFCFELMDDDFLYGDLVELTEDDVVLSSAKLGRIRLRRDRVRRIYHWKGADSIYLGPNGFAGWKENGPAQQWRDDGGQLQCDQGGSSIFGDLGIPAQAMIAFELSWQSKADFVLALGVDEHDATAPRGMHLEVWDDELVAVVESSNDADVTSLQKVGPGPGRVRFQAYLDQAKGRLILLSPSGKPLATLNTHPKKPLVHSGLRLTNGKGDVRLEYVRITRWNGQLPREAREDQPRIHRLDGSIAYGQLTAYDPKSKKFTLRDGATTTVVAQDAVADLYFAPPPPDAKTPGKSGTAPSKVSDQMVEEEVAKDGEIKGFLTEIERANAYLAKLRKIAVAPDKLPENEETKTIVKGLKEKIERRKEELRPQIRKRLEVVSSPKPPEFWDFDGKVRLSLRDGSRFSGVLARIENAHLTLTCPGIREPLRVPLTELRGMMAPRPGKMQPPAVVGKAGKLEADGLSLKGWLVGGTETPQASCLVWHPEFGLNDSPVVRGASGRVIYRDIPPPPKLTAPAPQANGPQARVVIFNGASAEPQAKAPQWLLPGGGKPGLHLRSGDTIPCEVIAIDEKGITLKSPISDTTFVANEKIKSIELTTTWGSTQVDEAKRDRLLTLPRLQRDAPPTHLICSKNGDFLRGRIISMDEKNLKVEVRLENRIIPRDRVAQIIWLHADELTGKPSASTAAQSNQKTRVQTVRANGDRLTFVADKADLKQISGRSDVLGPCHAALADVDQLLFGNSIEESAALLAYHLWKLHHAADPKYVQADAAGGGANGGVSGIESPLVGQPAIAFKLEMLDGAKFNLADRKGRIVVLDFWATWCGPCMQSMPMVDEVVREFADRGVDLVAVNMEEQAPLIKSTLERHKLKVQVALDRDGAVAAKYSVTAIPQTVVIDREGKVVRLFVGGGKQTADALRAAIKELIEGKPVVPAPK